MSDFRGQTSARNLFALGEAFRHGQDRALHDFRANRGAELFGGRRLGRGLGGRGEGGGRNDRRGLQRGRRLGDGRRGDNRLWRRGDHGLCRRDRLGHGLGDRDLRSRGGLCGGFGLGGHGLGRVFSAPQAAGRIHGDLEKSFIKAEVYTVDDLVKYKTEKAIKEAGKLRLEGKEYVMRDGDVVHFQAGLAGKK